MVRKLNLLTRTRNFARSRRLYDRTVVALISNIYPDAIRDTLRDRSLRTRLSVGIASRRIAINDVICKRFEARTSSAIRRQLPGKRRKHLRWGLFNGPRDTQRKRYLQTNPASAAFGVRRRLIARRGIPRVTSRPYPRKWSDRLFLLCSYSANRSTPGDACGRTALGTKSQRQCSNTGREGVSRFPPRLCFWYVIGWRNCIAHWVWHANCWLLSETVAFNFSYAQDSIVKRRKWSNHIPQYVRWAKIHGTTRKEVILRLKISRNDKINFLRIRPHFLQKKLWKLIEYICIWLIFDVTVCTTNVLYDLFIIRINSISWLLK